MKPSTFIGSLEHAGRALAIISTLLLSFPAQAQIFAEGGTSASPVDITREILSNSSVTLLGGSFVVTVPLAGSSGVTPAGQLTGLSAPLDDYAAGHFVGSNAPVIVYRGVLSGTGEVRISNATNALTNPQSGQTFDGGAVLFTAPQTYTNAGGVALIIDPNTSAAFDLGGNLGTVNSPINGVTNNGFLYSWNTSAGSGESAWCSINPTIANAGVVTFENGNVLSNGCSYSGEALVMNGAHLQQQGQLPDPATHLVQSNSFTFETQGNNYLTNESAITFAGTFPGNYYSLGAGTQITGNGIEIFTGLSLSGNLGSRKDFLDPGQSRLFDYFDQGFGSFGVPISIEATMQMGDGQAIVTYVDTNNGNTYVTNNTFLQSNLASSSIVMGGAERIPASRDDALTNQAIAFDYSGTYGYDAGVNASLNVQGKFTGAPYYGNLIVVNPDPQNTGKAPNHLIVTVPIMIHGITQIDQHAILQLGDGTSGHSAQRTLVINGTSFTGTYSTSYGNGNILTRLNAPSTTVDTSFDEIIDNGQLIVDNVPDASDLVNGDALVGAILRANELDHITGTGSLEQKGTLPLTLSGSSSFTGGITIDPGATLLVASAQALGLGNLVNHGVLASSGQNHMIAIAGGFTQQDVPVGVTAARLHEPNPAGRSGRHPLPQRQDQGQFAMVRRAFGCVAA